MLYIQITNCYINQPVLILFLLSTLHRHIQQKAINTLMKDFLGLISQQIVSKVTILKDKCTPHQAVSTLPTHSRF